MGAMPVPAGALYGASTARAVENFRVSGRPVPAEIIHAFGLVKAAAALVNRRLGLLAPRLAALVARAAGEVADGRLDAHFPVDVFQTGSGTSTNTNVNEVIANRCAELAGRPLGVRGPVHPNDHVNLGQSSNDTFPTATHVAAVLLLRRRLRPALVALHRALGRKARRWDRIVKVGRTHLQDATPIRLGQEVSGYAAQVEAGVDRCDRAVAVLSDLAIGGTAVGTGVNTHPRFARLVCAELSRATGHRFREVRNHFAAQATADAVVDASGQLRSIAVSLSKIANDVRWLGSGPRCGLGELVLPAVQPGSSIMPGKVNPVICESVIQVACQVVGHDTAVALGGFGGVGSLLELNVAMPLIAHNLVESIALLAAVTDLFRAKVVEGLEADRERCASLVERSIAMATPLGPVIGYDRAAVLAREAQQSGRTVREVARESSGLAAATLEDLLDPRAMTAPTVPRSRFRGPARRSGSRRARAPHPVEDP